MSQHGEALEQGIKSLQLKFNEIITSGHHYHTNELDNHIKHINDALDNIKLDHEFQRESKSWAKQFDRNDLNANRNNIEQLVAQGNNLVRELNTCLHTTTVQNKEENQMRELHSWACDSLINYLQSLTPYATGSYARLDNLAHHLGVTDRYIGYRHNLSRSGTQPINVHTVWADRKMPTSTTGQQSSTPDWKDWVHAFRHYGPNPTLPTSPPAPDNHNTLLGYLKPSTTTVSETPRPSGTAHSAQRSNPQDREYTAEVRKAGLNLIFPGGTEYMERYSQPDELPYSEFTINPQPDYTLPGRPLARLVPESYPSEYTHSFTFPDSARIEKFPWLRS